MARCEAGFGALGLTADGALALDSPSGSWLGLAFPVCRTGREAPAAGRPGPPRCAPPVREVRTRGRPLTPRSDVGNARKGRPPGAPQTSSLSGGRRGRRPAAPHAGVDVPDHRSSVAVPDAPRRNRPQAPGFPRVFLIQR